MGLFDDLFRSRDVSKPKPSVKSSKITSKNNIVLLRKRPLANTVGIRSSNSTLSLRSNNSLKQSNRSSPKNGRSAPNIPSRIEIYTKSKKTSSNNQIKSITKPIPPWHHNNNEIKIHGELKRPITIPDSSNISTRRGQTQASSKSEPGQVREDLTRCSSATNLEENKSKGAFSKLRKSASKDKLDKLTEKKNEKDVASNNNKLNSVDVDEAQEIEILQKQLNDMAKEKCDLVLELGERKGELQVLKNEIVKLKMFQEQSVVRIEQLSDENTSLRNRLRDVSHSPLSDNEKRQLLLDAERHSSAPASIATNLLEDEPSDITSCPTPDWDKHSSSNVSEVSVACLQDKINQMQETHYSTNEELQATLQELTDLQRQLTELQQDNERLSDEKNLMFDSLCRQTERLNDARNEVESLKQLLYREKDEAGQFESIVDREQKLVALLKSAQEERETLLVKQEQLSNDLQDAHSSNHEHVTEIEQLTERVRTLVSTLDAKHAEHKQLDQELAIAKDQCSGRQIEINRLTDLLENARTKINELEQERALNDKSELDELLDNARKEKDALESEVANLKEQVARSRNEIEKFREQVSILQEECKVTRNNAICTQSELEYKCEKLTGEKANLNEQLQQLQEAANELQVQAQCQLEDKRQLSTVLSETQRNLSEAERRNNELDHEIEELQRLRKDENEEWKKFQNDLLTSVRVANDFKSEAQQELEKMIMENKTHRDRIRQLETQIDKLKDEIKPVNLDDSVTQDTDESFYPNPEVRNLAILNDLYARIDTSLSQDQLTPEDRYIIKVKDALDADKEKIKPVAKKAKDKLAISKPLLTSVLSNPQLKEITENAEFSHADTESATVDSETISTVSDSATMRSSFVSLSSEFDKQQVTYETLEDLYARIDMDKTEDELTKEEKFVIKLKHSLDEMGRKNTLKKIVTRNKKKLRISEPIFTSVFSNPKLVAVLSDPNIKTVHELTETRDSIETTSLDDFLTSLYKIPRPTLLTQARTVYYDDISDVFKDLELQWRSNAKSVFSRPNSDINNTNYFNLQTFSAPKLDNDEVELVKRIHSNPQYSRPNSDLNEDDMKIISFAQAHSFDDDDGDELQLKKPIPLPRSKSCEESCFNANQSVLFDSSDTSKNFSNQKSKIREMLENEIEDQEDFRVTKSKVFGDVEKYYKTHPEQCDAQIAISKNSGVVNLFSNEEYSNVSSRSNMVFTENDHDIIPKGIVTQTDPVSIIDKTQKVDLESSTEVGSKSEPQPCLKVVCSYTDQSGSSERIDPIKGVLELRANPPRRYDSQSSFYNARKKFESLIESSHFKSDVMKKAVLRSFSKNT